jgi:hypothetical protein
MQTMKTILLVAAALLFAAPPANAQRTISEGMSAEQVRAVFGAPATVRTAGEWTYWYYHNGCPRRCGSDDVVFFRDQRVVAAVLRTAARRFAGPAAAPALEAAGGLEPGDGVGMYLPARDPVTVGGVRVESVPAGVIVVPAEPTVVNAEPTVGADLLVETQAEPETSVDRAHQRNLERAEERESAVDRARRIRDERQP